MITTQLLLGAVGGGFYLSMMEDGEMLVVLPKEIIFVIISFLSLDDIYRLSQTCHNLYEILKTVKI